MSRVHLFLPVLVVLLIAAAPSWAGDPMITRHANLGATIIVSNTDRYAFEDFVSALRPRFLEWVDVSTPRDQVRQMPEPVVFIIFLIRADQEGVPLHPSWNDDYPANLSAITRWNIELAARHLPAPDQKPPRESLLIKAPTDALLQAGIAEAFRFGRFPENRPITHPVVDLRQYPSVACLPSIANEEAQAVGEAAEVGLYHSLTELGAFRVVGRENRIIAERPEFSTQAQLQSLGRKLGVQAVAFTEIGKCQTHCKETTDYRTTTRKGVSPERQREYDQWARREREEGREVTKDRPDPDMVWAAQYHTRQYTTTVSGRALLVDANSGDAILVFEVEGSMEMEEADTIEDIDYRWYRMEDIDNTSYDSREFWADLRVVDAARIAGNKLSEFGDRLAARAILPAPGEEPPIEEGTEPTGPRAKVLSVDGKTVFINLGGEAGVEEGDGFSLWSERKLTDPDTGEVLETVPIRTARLEVAEVFAKTSRCDLIEAVKGAKLEPGTVVYGD